MATKPISESSPSEHNASIGAQQKGMLENIVIVGNNVHAYSVAAQLSQALRQQAVQLTVVEEAAVQVSSLLAFGLSAHQFHSSLGLNEADIIKHLGGAYCYGLALQGWYSKQNLDSIFTWTPSGNLIDGVHFHHYLSLLREAEVPISLEPFSIAAIAASEQRFTHPQPGTPFEFLDYSYQVDGKRYLDLLKAFCQDQGVKIVSHHNTQIECHTNNGQLQKLRLDADQTISADFVFDCTSAALIHSKLGQNNWHNCDTSLPIEWQQQTAHTTTAGTPCVATLVHENLEGAVRISKNVVTQGRVMTTQLAAQAFAQAEQYAIGYHPNSWAANCVLLGSAASNLGPILFDEFNATHVAIQRWLTLLPSKNAAGQSDLATEFNRGMQIYNQRVLDAHALVFSQADAGIIIPDSLVHRIDLFKETGRVAFYEDDVLSKDQWVNWFVANKIWPKRVDPLIRHLSVHDVQQQLQQQAQAVHKAVQTMPTHDQLLNAIRQMPNQPQEQMS